MKSESQSNRFDAEEGRQLTANYHFTQQKSWCRSVATSQTRLQVRSSSQLSSLSTVSPRLAARLYVDARQVEAGQQAVFQSYAQHVHISLSRSERAHAHRNVSHKAFDPPSCGEQRESLSGFQPSSSRVSRKKKFVLLVQCCGVATIDIKMKKCLIYRLWIQQQAPLDMLAPS